MHQPIGICSWSLRPRRPRDLAVAFGRLQPQGVQLALDPIRRGEWTLDETRRALDGAGVRILSGMIAMDGEDYTSLDSIRETGGVRPDEHWERNLRAARDAAEIAGALRLDLVTFHAGFLPEDPHDPERGVMVERLCAIADAFFEHGVRLGFETGQETADTLIDVLAEIGREHVGVNFDPANMLLYGKDDPIEALEKLASQVLQIHVKDAKRSPVPGEWGTEMPVGSGDVPWTRFFDVLDARELDVSLVIEREAGEERLADIAHADRLVRAQLERIGREPTGP